jgi:hypothetical protein
MPTSETSTASLVLTSLLSEEIEERVAAALPEAVLAKMFFIHRKRGFSTGCDCSYCDLKRQATYELGTIRFAPNGGHWGYRQMLARKFRKLLSQQE